MPKLPDDIIMRPFSKANWMVQARIIISRTFQRIMGEFCMGRFISYSGRVSPTTDINDVFLERVLKAYVYFIGLPFILNYSGDLIYKDPVLKPFFAQWEMANTYFKSREWQHWKQVKNGDWKPWRETILATTGYSKPLYDKFNPRASLANVERYKASRLLEMRDEGTLSDLNLCLLPERVLKGTTAPDKFFYYQSESVPLVSVFIGLDMIILLSNVYLMTIYRLGIDSKRLREKIPAWMQYQSARLSTPDGVTGKSYFDAQGKLTFTIPVVDNIPRKATIDTYGLKTYVDLTRVGMESVFLDPWDLVNREPPSLSGVFFDPWDLETREPPEMSAIILEPWDLEYNEPPAMFSVFIDPWGIPPPSYTSVFMETWVTAPPTYVSKLVDPWTS